MEPKESEPWTDAQGRVHKVKTSPANGQSEEDFCTQHDEAEAAARAAWPEV